MIRRGVTLIEMVVAVGVIAIMTAIAFPSIAAGLDSVRLHSAATSVASFLGAAMNRADRRQEVIEVVAEPAAKRLVLHSSEPGYERTLDLPSGVGLAGEEPKRLLLLPGGSIQRFSLELNNSRGSRRIVTLDPISATPIIVTPRGTP